MRKTEGSLPFRPKVEFNRNRLKIEQMLAEGWALKDVHQALKLRMSYQSLSRYRLQARKADGGAAPAKRGGAASEDAAETARGRTVRPTFLRDVSLEGEAAAEETAPGPRIHPSASLGRKPAKSPFSAYDPKVEEARRRKLFGPPPQADVGADAVRGRESRSQTGADVGADAVRGRESRSQTGDEEE